MSSSTHSVEEIKKHTRGYLMVFAALLALTVVTVALSKFHMPVPMAITVAMIVASIKASLVAAFFMHLISEKQVLFAILGLTVFFFGLLMLLPSLTTFFH